jgi:hypothetical protein
MRTLAATLALTAVTVACHQPGGTAPQAAVDRPTVVATTVGDPLGN